MYLSRVAVEKYTRIARAIIICEMIMAVINGMSGCYVYLCSAECSIQLHISHALFYSNRFGFASLQSVHAVIQSVYVV